MNLSRRDALAFLGLSALSTSLVTGCAPRMIGNKAKPHGRVNSIPSIHQFSIGSVRISAISDGYFDAPLAVFKGLSEKQLSAALKQRHAPKADALRIGFTVWLIEDGEQLVLIDSGTSGAFGPTAGRLAEALAALGVDESDITTVATTHMHADHIGGLLREGKPVFNRARITVPELDFKHFTDPAQIAKAPAHLKGSFDTAQAVVQQYPKLEQIRPKSRISAHIESVDLAGHTPGHMGFRIADGKESVVIVGDLLFDPAIHPSRSDVGIAFEANPTAARAMRRKYFPMFASEGTLLATTHMPFPGLGRIVNDGRSSQRWLPADWHY